MTDENEDFEYTLRHTNMLISVTPAGATISMTREGEPFSSANEVAKIQLTLRELGHVVWRLTDALWQSRFIGQ